ncbi:Tn3 family transposase [Brevibacillus centrosporus]|nr:Tn3 family transposase [Brevibacillus centrosporus]MED4907679.1 Tn3 family transposase [Brevibacillus centrosporus]
MRIFLTLPLNAISVWNTVYQNEATELLRSKGLLQKDLLKHISPLGTYQLPWRLSF